MPSLKELLQCDSKKILLEIGKALKKDITHKEDIQMASNHMRRCSTSLVIREMQIKTMMRYHLTSIRTAITEGEKKTENDKCWQGC